MRPKGSGVVPVEQRIWRYVLPDPMSGCWFWIGTVNSLGYGQIARDSSGVKVYAHRLMYEMARGEIPEGLVIDHLCRTPACVNPAHLEPVTQRENLRRGRSPSAIAVRTNTCHRGHDLSGAEVRSSGKRRCRLCRRKAA